MSTPAKHTAGKSVAVREVEKTLDKMDCGKYAERVEASLRKKWYPKTINTGSPHEQGLIIDETTGTHIAVTYDSKHADPIVRAVNSHDELVKQRDELRKALGDCITEQGALGFRSMEFARKRLNAINEIARAAIAKATEMDK